MAVLRLFTLRCYTRHIITDIHGTKTLCYHNPNLIPDHRKYNFVSNHILAEEHCIQGCVSLNQIGRFT